MGVVYKGWDTHEVFLFQFNLLFADKKNDFSTLYVEAKTFAFTNRIKIKMMLLYATII